ncbi:DNA replication licensing factor MCM3-like [Corticium candelabrum]|uniref:DNA replication licensing factor MCM3-like n=1 Tax=Corticium candelabrum TaxID=121492 RepID=UPI002E2698D6|nr:DNA replication licensing factor MCM3-like [Corticium candelabrum]
MALDIDRDLQRVQREYIDFLDDDAEHGVYREKVREMIRKGENRLIVNINALRRKLPKRAACMLNEAIDEVIAFQRALREFVASSDAVYVKQFEEFYIGFEGSFGNKHVTPRTLTSSYLGNLVCVEGIVTKCSLVRPKVVKSVHYCPATKKTVERRYSDLTTLNAFPSTSAYPTKDDVGNPLETEFGLSVYRDHQTLSMQEMPEKAPAGQLPRSVDIILDGDLVDICKPGDRIQVIGIYRCLPSKKNSYTSCSFRTVVLANNIVVLSKETSPKLIAEDVQKMRQFRSTKRFNKFEMLARSLAPSIHGHEWIKQAVLCLLLGGTEKVLENGTRLRGDINVLLIGDPSTAKSQMLRYVLHSAPRAITTTGRGSSGVGLTAAVTTDPETGDRTLEAGAMVLADRGVVCIDEFDKMTDIDRTAIHEVMEQGRVTIAKAGIHAKLNARCSVLAAANPVYGRYDEYKPPMDNIGMQDSLLSRFDLIFIVLDEMDPDYDRDISDHVLRMHRYRAAGEQDGEAMQIGGGGSLLSTVNLDVEDDGYEETHIFEKHDSLLHGKKIKDKNDKFKHRRVSMVFLKKYIHVARLMKPALTRESCDMIAAEYSKLRTQDTSGTDKAKTQPVTARTLETMIRLSTAHAKGRLSKTVDEEDAQFAIDMINYAYFKKVSVRQKRRKIEEEEEEESQDDDENDAVDDDDDDNDGETSRRRRSPRTRSQQSSGRKTRKSQDECDPYHFGSDVDSPAKRRAIGKQTADRTSIDDERLAEFRSVILRLFSSEHAQSISLQQVQQAAQATFTESETAAALEAMQTANQVMVADGTVFLI